MPVHVYNLLDSTPYRKDKVFRRLPPDVRARIEVGGANPFKNVSASEMEKLPSSVYAHIGVSDWNCAKVRSNGDILTIVDDSSNYCTFECSNLS